MKILFPIEPADKPRPHDPLACGLGFDSDCTACQHAKCNAPAPPLKSRLWTWLTKHVSFLGRYRGHNETAPQLVIDNEDKAKLLAMLCDGEMQEAVLAVLVSSIRKVARDELSNCKEAAK